MNLFDQYKVNDDIESFIRDKSNPELETVYIGIVGLVCTGKSTLINAMFGTTFNTKFMEGTIGIMVDVCIINNKNYVVFDTEGDDKMVHENRYMQPFKMTKIATFLAHICDIIIYNFAADDWVSRTCFQLLPHLFLGNQNKTIIFVARDVYETRPANDMLKTTNLFDEINNITKLYFKYPTQDNLVTDENYYCFVSKISLIIKQYDIDTKTFVINQNNVKDLLMKTPGINISYKYAAIDKESKPKKGFKEEHIQILWNIIKEIDVIPNVKDNIKLMMDKVTDDILYSSELLNVILF